MTGNRLWTIGVIVIIAAVVVIGWFLAISPVVVQATAAEEQAQSISAQNASSDASLAALQAQYAKLPEIEAKLATLQGAAPSSASLDDFLDQLQNLAQATGVTITSFTAAEATAYGSAATGAGATAPATPTPSASPSPGATGATVAPPAATTGGALAGKLFTVPVTLNLSGPADNVMAFTKAAQTGPRFFLVTGATFSGASTPSSSIGSLTGYIFVVREPGTPAEGSGATTTSPTPSATPTPTPSESNSAGPTATPTPTATVKP